MKTKHGKDEVDKTIDEDTAVEPKTRARKKASDIVDEEKTKPSDEPKTSKEPKKNVNKPKTIVKKRPLGIRKTLRSKKVIATKEKLKNVIKQTAKRGRKPAIKADPDSSQPKETVPLIPASEIKKEPLDETSPNSRSSSPKTAGRRPRQSSDIAIMKSVLGDSPTIVHGPRSPYSMRSERSNSPSLLETKNLRSTNSRKAKKLLTEVVIKEQNKRRRLPSEPKVDSTESIEDCKKKRLRSCSHEGSEISKCSDYTESDISLSETLNDTDKELNKKLDKAKTDLDVDIENNLQISTIDNVPSINIETKLIGTKLDTEPISNINEKSKRKLSLKRSVSSDSDNNNSNKLKIDSLNQTASDVEDKLLGKTENDTLIDARSSILTSMSKTFNSKELSKNIRKARRGRKAAAAARPSPTKATSTITTNTITSTITNDSHEPDDKHETLELLSKEINDLINDLDQNIDGDQQISDITATTQELQTKTPSKFYGLSKPLGDNNSIIAAPETPIKDKDVAIANESTPTKNDDSENFRLRYEDSVEKCKDGTKPDVAYKCSTVASIDKLMDRLKEFEEFDKRRNRQESESKSGDEKSVMVSNDVVLINKSGADIKPFKDIQARSPEKPVEKENLLNCFVNNSAISIVKMDHVRKSIDVDRPNAITLIKRNSISSRKESTSSNHAKEVSDSDAISLFEKSLGKDVTLTKKTSDKSVASAQVDLHQFATLQPNNSKHSLVGVMLDSNQISITPRVADPKVNNSSPVTKRNSRGSDSRKSSECITDTDEKMATIEKIKTPPPQVSSAIPNTPVAVKSPEIITPVEKEALGPPLENIKAIPEDISLTSDVSKLTDISQSEYKVEEPKVSIDMSDAKPVKDKIETVEQTKVPEKQAELPKPNNDATENKIQSPGKQEVSEKKVETSSQKTDLPKKKIELKRHVKTAEKPCKTPEISEAPKPSIHSETLKTAEKVDEFTLKMDVDVKPENKIALNANDSEKPAKFPEKTETDSSKARRRSSNKSARSSFESQPGPSSAIHETPESQKRKENVLRTLGLLTHKAAKEAKIEKLKEKERIYGMGGLVGKKKAQGNQDYTGTLKTVIKLSRGSGDREKKRHRSSLKMTFQKSKHRSGKPTPEVGEAEADDAFYTIERREGATVATTDGGLRKHHSNRLNNDAEVVPEPEVKETLNLVIPEKASSFSIHPGRLCMDQCFYCGGKFGLFDTPCHIAQMKSSERQKKVLLNEEKLTIDSCLCDACYRHVDRRANCPSYRKRPVVKPVEMTPTLQTPAPQTPAPQTAAPANITPPDKPPSPAEDESSEESPVSTLASGRPATCHTEGCTSASDHSIRRKWLIKMRTSVSRVLKLQGDYPGLHTIPLCGEHYRSLSQLMECALCRRRITKHHNVHFIHHGYQDLNPLLKEANIPVQFTERPVLCKICRDYCSHLLKPEKSDRTCVDQQSAAYYTRKLMQIYNVEVSNEFNSDIITPNTSINDDANSSLKQKKKIRIKTKSPISLETEKLYESSDKTESSPEKDNKEEPMEEDIESLISSNKILVPGAKNIEKESDGSESDVNDLDIPALPYDKQTELQYLLQKQNNPAQFLPKANLTQKQKSLHKVPHGIQKPGHLHRINDKNSKRLHKLGQIITQKDKSKDVDMLDPEKHKEGLIIKNITLSEECTIESVPIKRPADINTLKNKWQMSESFSQVKKNLSELSKKLDKDPSTKKMSEKFSNPVKRLETNPSISVRELFPGEEEMNLQCNVEFNNVKGVTPEGWEKCNTTIQYDVETKRLWNELQRPYGNQSSFLRHLILLEKYFRSGDLVLAHNATPNASNYSDSVQSRLRAYDNVVNDTPRRSEPAISLIEFRKKPSVNGKSLLKSNQIEEQDPKKVMPPPPKPKPKADKTKKNLPPELIAINTPNAQGRKAIQNVLHNIQQLVKGVSASDPTEVAASPVPIPVPPPMPAKIEPPKEKKEVKSDTTRKTKPTSKPWRPTLMPITQENISRIEREPKQVAVDGRSLPSLVQVMSSGKRYHITLQDYNKMCIMRREKLQQLHDGETKSKRLSTEETTLITEIQPSAMLGNGGTMTQNIPAEDKPKDMPELTSNAATMLKNVGLKNITIAPIPLKTATVTSQTLTCPIVSSPSLLVTSTPIKIPQLGPSVSITTETVLTPNLPVMTSSAMIMPKIPKSLTVIPQTVVANVPQSLVVQTLTTPSQAFIQTMEVPRP